MDEKHKEKIGKSVKKHWERIKDTDKYTQWCNNMSKADKGRPSYWKGKHNLSLVGNTNAKGNTPWNKGVPMSDVTKKKVSEAKLKNPTRYWLGKKRPDLHKIEGFDRTGKEPWNKGKECSELSKDKHWNWQDGKSSERHDYCFKNAISPMLRKEYPCFVCGTKDDLIVHHTDLDKHNNKITNLLVMCRPHHSEIHATIQRLSK